MGPHAVLYAVHQVAYMTIVHKVSANKPTNNAYCCGCAARYILVPGATGLPGFPCHAMPIHAYTLTFWCSGVKSGAGATTAMVRRPLPRDVCFVMRRTPRRRIRYAATHHQQCEGVCGAVCLWVAVGFWYCIAERSSHFAQFKKSRGLVSGAARCRHGTREQTQATR